MQRRAPSIALRQPGAAPRAGRAAGLRRPRGLDQNQQPPGLVLKPLPAGHLTASLMPRVGHDSEAVNVDHGKVFGRGLKDVPLVVDLDELAPVGGRATGGRDGRWLERLAQVCKDLGS